MVATNVLKDVKLFYDQHLPSQKSICVIADVDIFWRYCKVPLVLLASPPLPPPPPLHLFHYPLPPTPLHQLPFLLFLRKKDLGQTGNLVDELFLCLATWHPLKAAGEMLWKVSLLLLLLAKQA